MATRVLLADDQIMFRDGLRSLVERLPDTEVVGEAKDGREAVRLAKKLTPDIVVMDVSMPDLNGIEATRQLVAEVPITRVIVLSMHGRKDFVTEALKAGASGYLLKDHAFDELERAIEAVLNGQRYLCPRVTSVVIDDMVGPRTPRQGEGGRARLTPRETEVLQLVAEGKNTKQIAAHLRLGQKTVETHRRNLMDKLKIDSIANLTKYAIRIGLTSLDF